METTNATIYLLIVLLSSAKLIKFSTAVNPFGQVRVGGGFNEQIKARLGFVPRTVMSPFSALSSTTGPGWSQFSMKAL